MWLVGWVTGEIGLKAKAKQTRVGAEACKNLPTFKKNLPRSTDPRILKKSGLCLGGLIIF